MKKKKAIIIFASLLIIIIVVILLLAIPQRDIYPIDATSAKLAMKQALKRQNLCAHEDQIELISTSGTWLSDYWVFGILNPFRPLLGGPRYEKMYLVGPAVVPERSLGVDSHNVTFDFSEAFKWLVNRKPPTTESEALDIAKCYVCLVTGTRPSNLNVLRKDKLPSEMAKYSPAEAISSQIVSPEVHSSEIAGLRENTVFTIELCSFSNDSWGDIIFWHIVIGKHNFSAATRPIFLAARALE